MPALYLGIDPGKGGGIVALSATSVCGVWPMPATEADIWAIFSVDDRWLYTMAYIEGVHAMPKQGVTSAFTFGKGYGALLMALTAAGIPFEIVSPQKWQKALGCLSRGDKNITKRKAQQLFPQVKVTHAIADALLIAEYGRRLHQGR